MLKLWGRVSSVNVQKVVWCCDELGIAYSRTDAGGAFGIVNTPEYRALNPNGLIPVIEDEGFVLYESNAIVRYLAGKQDTPLWPREARARADVDRWMEWQATGYTPAMLPVFWGLVRTPPEKRDAAAIEASRAKSETFSAVLDAHLAKRSFVTGETFTVADIVIGCAVHRWLGLPLERIARPNVERYYRALCARPGAKGVVSLPVN